MPWPWPLSAVEDWFKSWRSWISSKLSSIGALIEAIDWSGFDWFTSWRSWLRSKLNAIGNMVASINLDWIITYFMNLRNTITSTANRITSSITTSFNSLAGAIAGLPALIMTGINQALYSNEFTVFVWNFAVGEVNKVLKKIVEALEE